MASIKSLYNDIDINAVEVKARSEWGRSYRRRQSLEKVVIGLLPSGVILMVVIFFFLSVPHTQRILEMITPGAAGFLSPLGFELGVIIFSALREAGWKSRLTGGILAVLLLLSIFINVSGSFISVVESAGSTLTGKTVNEIISAYGDLTAIYQIVLIVTVFVGALIPVIAKLAGEGMIKLALGRIKLVTSDTEISWAKEVSEVMYRALMKEAILHGANAALASGWAEAVATKMYGRGKIYEPTEMPPTPSPQPLPAILPTNQSLPQPMPMQSVFTPRVKSDELEIWMQQNSVGISNLSNREVAKMYTKEKFGVESENSYKTVERIRSK